MGPVALLPQSGCRHVSTVPQLASLILDSESPTCAVFVSVSVFPLEYLFPAPGNTLIDVLEVYYYGNSKST